MSINSKDITEMNSWFHSKSKIIQVLLLIIPVVNWVMEMILRWSRYLKKGGLKLLFAILVTIVPIGIFIGWIDAICTGITNKLICE